MHLLHEAFLKSPHEGEEYAEAAEAFREPLRKVDPAALGESDQGYKALSGIRLRRTYEALSQRPCMPFLWSLSICLGALRYVSKYLQASVHSVRARARFHGYEHRPPLLDLTNPAHSPIIVAMEFLSAVLAAGPDSPILGILLDFVGRRRGGLGSCPSQHQLRIGAVVASTAMHWRHRVRFKRMPYALAVTVDDRATPEARRAAQHRFLSLKPCCLGFTAADLQSRIAPGDIEQPGCWTARWASTLWSAFDSMGLNTGDAEGIHASQQRLFTGGTGSM